MECRVSSTKVGCSAQGLIQTLLAVGIGSVLLMAVASVYYLSARSFSDLANYLDLDSQSRTAFDRMGKDIRQADRLTSYATNRLVFQSGTNQITFTYDSTNRTLTR